MDCSQRISTRSQGPPPPADSIQDPESILRGKAAKNVPSSDDYSPNHDVTILVITHHRSEAIGSLSLGLSHNLIRTVHYNKILLVIVLVGYHLN